MLKPLNLRVAALDEASGLNGEVPRFSWGVSGDAKAQSAFRVVAGTDPENVAEGRGDLFDSGRREVSWRGVTWDSVPPASDRAIWWSVALWDEDGQGSGFAPPVRFFTGLRPEDWQAQWIARYFVLPAGRDVPQGNRYDNRFQARPADYLRREMALVEKPVRAFAYVTALGLYEFCINGARIGDHVMAPGWTDYHTRVEYQTFDVTGLFAAGENVIGAILGEGWYSGRIGHNQRRAGNHYGGRPAFKCQIHLEYADGRVEKIVSDGSWQTTQGPILYSDFLAGEAYDARLEIDGWHEAGFDAASWQPVEAFIPEPGPPALDAQRVQPTREVARFEGRLLHEKDGLRIYDFSQNLAGYAELKVRAPAGTVFRLRFAERLRDDGGLYLDNMRYAVNEDIYIARGAGEEVFKPRFTFRGFQYAGLAIEGAAESEPQLTAIAIQTDTPVRGKIETGNALVNRLLSNIVWGQRGNFLSVPTDCPQRDERYGWSADAQVFWRTAGYNMDVEAFLNKWMVDLADGQSPEGAFPDVAPTKPLNPYRLTPQPGAPGWGDAPIIMAWHHFMRYGDRDLLVGNYDRFVAWMDYIEAANPDGLRINRNNNNYGDWLNVGPKTDPFLVASAYWVHLADLMEKIAGATGRDRWRWQKLGERLRKAFVDAYWRDGRLISDTQTAYLLALDFAILPEALRGAAASRLRALFEAADWHLQTGFLGVRHVCPVVADHIGPARAVDLLLQETYPSWGFSIRHGATTIWERWDGWTPEGGFQSPNMNSFNHYAYGAVGEWIWSRLAGIDWSEAGPGYAHVMARPVFDRRIGHVTAAYEARTGTVESRWRIDGESGAWELVLPPSVTADVELPEGLGAVVVDDAPFAGRHLRLACGAHRFRFILPG
ncbi:alpha-L-rhamnosidase [Martelella lutilitoris]|uniref:alpha-L-rhamnosidase n=1 Tax=Martelella lutilitoris TaxID=2583532 RepID=A0A5C4JSJ0_9HYPH|nr:alpha-L-rhamnosidase [Martelella lutilitoris]TNB48425.1 alpha-L-rhamnosidase [Martelella lutilitoris]